MLTRREFFGLLGGVVVHEIARPIYVLPPLRGWKRTGSSLVVHEAASFNDGEHVEIFGMMGGLRTKAIIDFIDPLTNTIWLRNAVQANNGDIILAPRNSKIRQYDWFTHGDGSGVLSLVTKAN